MFIKIEMEHKEDCFVVNGVTLEKSNLAAVFPGDPEKALAKYLCIVPFLHEKAEHFRKHHALSPAAAWGIDKASEVLKAINLPEEAYIPWMMALMAQAETDPDDMSDQCKNAFGKCGDPDHEDDFTEKHTVH